MAQARPVEFDPLQPPTREPGISRAPVKPGRRLDPTTLEPERDPMAALLALMSGVKENIQAKPEDIGALDFLPAVGAVAPALRASKGSLGEAIVRLASKVPFVHHFTDRPWKHNIATKPKVAPFGFEPGILSTTVDPMLVAPNARLTGKLTAGPEDLIEVATREGRERLWEDLFPTLARTKVPIDLPGHVKPREMDLRDVAKTLEDQPNQWLLGRFTEGAAGRRLRQATTKVLQEKGVKGIVQDPRAFTEAEITMVRPDLWQKPKLEQPLKKRIGQYQDYYYPSDDESVVEAYENYYIPLRDMLSAQFPGYKELNPSDVGRELVERTLNVFKR